MKTGELLISVVILVGSLFVTAVTLIAESIRTGVPSLDRFEIRYRIAFWAFRRFGPRAATDLRIPRALMAIVNNESGGVADIKHYLGDKTAKGGPSIGPMQVYRQTAKDLGLWRPPPGATAAEERAAYEALALDEALGIEWGTAVFADKLRIAKGDISEAVRRYNGAGERAELYRDKALAFFSDKWGALT